MKKLQGWLNFKQGEMETKNISAGSWTEKSAAPICGLKGIQTSTLCIIAWPLCRPTVTWQRFWN